MGCLCVGVYYRMGECNNDGPQSFFFLETKQFHPRARSEETRKGHGYPVPSTPLQLITRARAAMYETDAGFSKIIIEHDHRGVENLTKFDERVCDMVLANVNRVWDIYSDANWWDAPHASAQVKALLDHYNYFPSSWPEYEEALEALQSQPSTQHSQILSFRWLFKPRRP